ncbi:MAG: DUF1428 domain-containing protein [Lysobacteraceae bacterium]|nr:MAG: DUF1428 domain-containing protein [Xanthomonadaceae bacterium]
MSYFDGFILAVPTANRQKFIDHAKLGDSVFMDLGALRILECWADDVPDGKLTDFRKSVQATADESVVFSWIEWPDKAARDAAMEKMMSGIESDPRLSPETNPMPFDGKRMIYGGFAPLLELGAPPAALPYVDGIVLAVPTANKQQYTDFARKFDDIFIEFGALRIVEGWGDDVPDGKLTDFRRAVQAGADESVVFSWIEWPDKAIRDAGMKKMMEDPRMDPANPDNPKMPFDGKRMFFGGFRPVVALTP